jgi:Ca2+-binding RTX toxin-like protein
MANVYGDDSNQSLKGTAGADELYGGAGNDILLGNLLSGASGDGTAGSPYVYLISSPSGNDLLEGGSGVDVMYGGDGDDVVYGGEGDDSGSVNSGGTYYKAGLYGGDGDDALYGGGGDDELTGGLGQDDMYGGTGADTFFFSSIDEIGKGSTADLIGDFVRKQDDVIDLSAIDAKEGKNGNQKFKYIGDDKFTKEGQISFKNGKVKFNTDDDKGAEAVLFVNTHKMVADDFVL